MAEGETRENYPEIDSLSADALSKFIRRLEAIQDGPEPGAEFFAHLAYLSVRMDELFGLFEGRELELREFVREIGRDVSVIRVHDQYWGGVADPDTVAEVKRRLKYLTLLS